MIIKKEDYEKYADCIRSDQVSAPEVVELFEDTKFRQWYRKRFNLESDREETPHKEWIKGYREWKKTSCPHN